MLIRVRVNPNARLASVVKVDEADYEVKVDEKAIGGRANARLLEILSDHFKVSKSRISIVKGARSRDKIVRIVP
jgi:uncharacterized protein (TIGR00251 family)